MDEPVGMNLYEEREISEMVADIQEEREIGREAEEIIADAREQEENAQEARKSLRHEPFKKPNWGYVLLMGLAMVISMTLLAVGMDRGRMELIVIGVAGALVWVYVMIWKDWKDGRND